MPNRSYIRLITSQIGRTPYGIIYQARENYILIVAVAHLHRKPGYWKDRTVG